jgi:hypothetical protein
MEKYLGSYLHPRQTRRPWEPLVPTSAPAGRYQAHRPSPHMTCARAASSSNRSTGSQKSSKTGSLTNNRSHSFPTTTGDFISKANMVKRIEIGATSLGTTTHSRTRAYLRGGHAYRRGIVHHLALSGVEVSCTQSLLRYSSTSKAILRYLRKSMAHSSAGLAQDAALGSTLNSVRAEISANRGCSHTETTRPSRNQQPHHNNTMPPFPKHLAVFEQQGSIATQQYLHQVLTPS